MPQTYERIVEAKFELVGTVDDIRRELDAHAAQHGNLGMVRLVLRPRRDELGRTAASARFFGKIIREFKGT